MTQWRQSLDEMVRSATVSNLMDLFLDMSRAQALVLKRLGETAPPNDLLSVINVAERWQVSPQLVRELCHSGDLAFVRVGKYMRIAAQDANAFVERGGTTRTVGAASMRRAPAFRA